MPRSVTDRFPGPAALLCLSTVMVYSQSGDEYAAMYADEDADGFANVTADETSASGIVYCNGVSEVMSNVLVNDPDTLVSRCCCTVSGLMNMLLPIEFFVLFLLSEYSGTSSRVESWYLSLIEQCTFSSFLRTSIFTS